MLKKIVCYIFYVFFVSMCRADEVSPFLFWQMVETDNLGTVNSDIENPYVKLYIQANTISLQHDYNQARAREQSTANKLLSGAAIGAAGIGGMMLASGLAEQAADADAETAMRAYLETFYCKVGDGGKNIKGGTRGAIVPGGNELIKLYSEYVSLANDLKARKTALGMKPGIESEAILDSATSGLYDDISVGKTGGAYASLARALQNPDGEDAKKWSEQKAASASDVKTGAIVGGVGAVGGAVGNLIINKDKK